MKKLITLLLIALSLSATNRLIDEDSPYLRSHAANPVDWYPWSQSAFDKAEKEHKLIFLSIGYSTCHWCHVMEEESFEAKTIAGLLNANYISIKVDKESMPHIDRHFQRILTKLSQQRNGWPLSVIMTPKKEVVYITTYIPPTAMYGVEGMTTLLPNLADLYHNRPKAFQQLLQKNREQLQRQTTQTLHLKDTLAKSFIMAMEEHYDDIYKGFYKRPRFPLVAHLHTLLDIYLLEQDNKALKMAIEPLIAMAKGGIFDQVEGGFFRYSVDPDWIIPHFEKMLYTNAELSALYLKAYTITNNPLFKVIAFKTIDAMNHRFLTSDHLYLSASDADSVLEDEKREGGYFIYSQDQVEAILEQHSFSDAEIEEIFKYLDIGVAGNFEDGYSNIVHNTYLQEPKRLSEVFKLLKTLREERVYPYIDQKIQLSWNAMMIKSLLLAAQHNPHYAEQAKKSFNALMDRFYRDSDQHLFHYYHFGHTTHSNDVMLEDYAYLIDLLVTKYQVDGNKSTLKLAKKLGNEAIEKFYTEEKTWILNQSFPVAADFSDRHYTAPLSLMFHNLQILADLTYDYPLMQKVKTMLKQERYSILGDLDQHPAALRALLRHQHGNIILKSNRSNLRKNQTMISHITYPFLLQSTDTSDTFSLCNATSCFMTTDDLAKIIRYLQSNH
jgi:uncharacterized protein YyaL (SSP411 family)